ncbi:MAG: hypothetical protein AB8U82_05930 [Rickettsia endosymbiont of Haemaphysalis japonica]
MTAVSSKTTKNTNNSSIFH